MTTTNELPRADSPPDGAAPGRGAAPPALRLAPLAFVAALAFLLASFPARNAELWTHLAAGRQLAGHASPLTTSWVFDLGSYALYSVLGGGLVVVNALLAAAVALVLARLGWAGRGWGVPASCAALAVLAMSPRLLVQPATVSCLFLALALLLVRDGERPSRPLPPWPLAVLFLVWANTDGRFLLGLAAVGLAWVGQAVDRARSTTKGERGASAPRCSANSGGLTPPARLFWYSLDVLAPLAVLAGVCLLNPAHLGAFTTAPWPPATADTRGVTSPFQTAYFAKVATSPAGLAYFPLLALGALSFLWNLPGWSWRRALPWLGLALLSAFQVRAVPFFAVVAGPVLALNLQEALARRPRLALPPGPARRREEVAGRVLATVAGVALIACAWPGWLQGQPYGRRSWAVEPSPALERGAAATLRWHRDGKLTAESRGLHLSPESAAAFAWLCPEEPAVVDEGLAAAVRGEESAGAGWEERMRSAGVDHVFVYDPDREGLLLTFGRLLADPHTWPLLYLEGDLAVFGWRDPNTAPDRDRFAGLRLDLDAVAFRSPGQSLAPRTGPDLAPPPWWAALRRPPPEPSIDHGEAVLHLMHAEALQLAAPFRQRIAWEYGQPAAVVGAAAGWTGPADLLNAQGRLVLLGKPPRPSGASLDTLPFADQVGLAWREVYAAGRDDVPPALLYLAIRAARRAVADDPQDARAYLVLGECYLRFLRGTRERAWSARMPRIAELRYAQASAALNRAVALKPDLAQAHLSLARLYGGSGYYDLALDHARSHLRLFRAAGPPRGVSADEFREEEEGLQEEVDRLAKEVEGRRQLLAAASGGADTLERALNASEKGLKKRALELLQESDVANFGARGMELELGLLLTAGRPQDVRDWTTPQHKEALGAASYHWLRARARAACGDYEAAEEECAAMLPAGADPVLLRRQMALRIGEAVLDEAPGGGEWPTVIRKFVSRPLFRERVFDLGRGLRQDADVRVVRGLLALEEGRTAEAGADFRLALEIWKNSETAASGGGMDFSGRGVAQDCLRWLGQEPPAR